MKKLFCLLMFVWSVSSLAAQALNDSCHTATPFVPGYVMSYPAGVNTGTAETGPDYGCLFSQPNPAWYYGIIPQSGNVVYNLHSNPAQDIDFAVWGPFTTLDSGCLSLDTNHLLDCSYSTSWNESIHLNNILPDQYYIFLFTNYSNQACNILMSQLDSTFVQDTLYSTVDTCFTITTVDTAYVADVYTTDSVFVQWVLVLNGDTSYVEVPYTINAPGAYLFTLTITCNGSKALFTVSNVFTVTNEDLGLLGLTTPTRTTDHIYPNPMTNYLRIQSSKAVAQVKLTNTLGQEWRYNTAACNTEQLPGGLYVVTVTFKDQSTYTTKILK